MPVLPQPCDNADRLPAAAPRNDLSLRDYRPASRDRVFGNADRDPSPWRSCGELKTGA